MNTAPFLPSSVYLNAPSSKRYQTITRRLLWEKRMGYIMFCIGMIMFVVAAGAAFMQLPYTTGIACTMLTSGFILMHKGFLPGLNKNKTSVQSRFTQSVTRIETPEIQYSEHEKLERKLRSLAKEEGSLYILLVISLLMLQVTEQHNFWKGITNGTLVAVSTLLFINTYRMFIYNRYLKLQSQQPDTIIASNTSNPFHMKKKMTIRVLQSGNPVKGLRVYATTLTAVHENKETTPTAQTDQNGFATLSWQNNFFLSAIYINDQLAVKGRFYPGGNKLIEIERSSPVPE